MENLYYLHFKDTVPQQLLDAFRAEGASLQPVFETSFYMATDLSFSEVKHIFKTSPFIAQCNVVKVKNNAQFLASSQ